MSVSDTIDDIKVAAMREALDAAEQEADRTLDKIESHEGLIANFTKELEWMKARSKTLRELIAALNDELDGE